MSRSAIRAIIDELVRQRDAIARAKQAPSLVAANTVAIAYWRRRLDLGCDEE